MSNARISEAFWTDPKIRRLNPDGKLLFLYLITNPHRHYSGIYYLPIGLIPIETGLKGDCVNKALNDLIDLKIAVYDAENYVIFIPNMFLHQAGGEAGLNLTDKQSAGVVNHLRTLHNSKLIDGFLNVYKYLGLEYEKKINPTETPLEGDRPISQSQSKSKSKSQSKKGASPVFFSCQFFSVDEVYRQKLKIEYPVLEDQLLLKEFSKMEDWLTDNPKPRRSNGTLKNPKSFIRYWLEKVIVPAGVVAGKPCSQPGISDWLREEGNDAER